LVGDKTDREQPEREHGYHAKRSRRGLPEQPDDDRPKNRPDAERGIDQLDIVVPRAPKPARTSV
jgi:hypothetical protein